MDETVIQYLHYQASVNTGVHSLDELAVRHLSDTVSIDTGLLRDCHKTPGQFSFDSLRMKPFSLLLLLVGVVAEQCRPVKLGAGSEDISGSQSGPNKLSPNSGPDKLGEKVEAVVEVVELEGVEEVVEAGQGVLLTGIGLSLVVGGGVLVRYLNR